MAGFGDLLLNLLGQTNPRTAAVGQLLNPRAGGRTPGGTGIAPAMGAPGAPAQPQAYTSQPDLMELYDSLSKRNRKEQSLDRGIGLIAASFAQPENREFIMNAFGAPGSGQSDPLELVTQIAEAQQAAAAAEQAQQEKQRQLAMVPAIAEQYGIDETSARLLLDNDQLDDFVMEKSKYQDADTSLVDTPNGKALIENGTGRIIKDYGVIPPNPTSDIQNLDRANADRAAANKPPLSMEEWIQLGRPQGVSIHNNLGPRADAEIIAGLDKIILEDFTKAGAAVTTIQKLQQARRSLNAPGGIVSGDILAPVRLETMKLASSVLGLPNEAAANTEAFQSSMKEIVLPLVKQLGTGNSISNADREFVEKATGGDIRLTEDAVRRIISVMERGQRNEIIKANQKLQRRIEDADEDSPLKKRKGDLIPVPDLSPEAEQDLLNIIMDYAPGHVEELLKDPTPEDMAEFDTLYGPGASEIVMRNVQR
jgi:hypothetical protein